MSNKLLELGCCFDWISPVLAWIQDLRNGPSHTCLVPEDCSWSGREIQQLLQRHGIKVWGAMIVNRTIMLTVRAKQARYAQYLFDRHGVPTLNSPRHSKTRHRPPKGREPGLYERGQKWLDGFAKTLGL